MSARRMRRWLAGALVLVVTASLVPAGLVLSRDLRAEAERALREALVRDAGLVAGELAAVPDGEREARLGQLARRAGELRLTLLDLDGRVRADSAVTETAWSGVESHANRPEFQAARAGRVGEAVRHSATIDRDLYYVAVPVGAPPSAVLRAALPLEPEERAEALLAGALTLAALCGLGAALATAFAFAGWLGRPLGSLTRAARMMARGDFGVVLPPPRDDELGDLVLALDTLRRQTGQRVAELRSESDRLRTILNAMDEGVALVQRGHITFANPAFERLVGVEDAAGRTPLEAARLPELSDILETALVERQPASREAQRGSHALTLQAYPLGDPGTEQAVVVLLDITEGRRLERLRRDFVANASHELRTPVAAILGVAETLTAGASEDPEARATFVDILQRHAQRLSRLTADLLDIARLEGGYRPRVESVALAATVATVLATLGERAAHKRITLTTELPAGLHVSAERAAVEQILSNFVDNAIKYTPEGGAVKVSATARGQRVHVVVDDTGPGIPSEHLPRLFERFYRVDNARSRELGGTGLGLAIVKHLALANGGDVWVESTVGQGTRFGAVLPIATAANDAAPAKFAKM